MMQSSFRKFCQNRFFPLYCTYILVLSTLMNGMSPVQVDKARQELEQLGYHCYETQIGGPGARAWCMEQERPEL
jgi:hypothetical protein